MSYRRTGMALLAVSAVLSAGITAVSMVSASAEASTDTELIRNAVRNFQARGVQVAESDLFVLRARTAYGEEWRVAPKGTRFDVERAGTDAAGREIHTITATVVVEPPTEDPAGPAADAAAAPEWVRLGSGCWDAGIKDDKGRDQAIRTVCFDRSFQRNDDDPAYAFYQFKLDASGRSVDVVKPTMKRIWVEMQSVVEPNFPRTAELDGLPEPATEQKSELGCRDVGLTVSSGSPVTVGFSYSKQLCEKWLPKSYPDSAATAHWSNTWHGATRDQRQVGLNVPMKIAAGYGFVVRMRTGQEID